MGGPIVKIRYADLPEGLHALAEAQGRHAIIYLRPGLTTAQRREGLRRARQTARMGYGPRLPAARVEAAVAADRVRITIRNATAAVRHHPASSAMLAAALSTAVVCYVLFVSVSIRFIRPPLQAQTPRLRPGQVEAPRVPGPTAGGQRGADAPGPGAATTGPASRHSSPPSPKPSGLSPAPTPAPSPAPTPPASPGPSPSPSGMCLNVGPLGVCLSM